MFRLFQQDIRASDADREETVELLKRHYADGRLSSTELSGRVDAAYAAVGLLDLDALTRDLPPLPPVPAARQPAGYGRRARALAAAALAVMAVVVIASVIPPELWALLIFFGLPILMMGLFVLLPVALPVLAMAWLSRSLGARQDAAPRQLGRGPGWSGTWYVGEFPARRDPVGSGRRR